jgi:hypothetical protein
MVFGSGKSRLSFSNFSSSEMIFFYAGSFVSGKHSSVSFLFIMDLLSKFIKKSINIGKWSASSNLGFDLSEEVTEVGSLQGSFQMSLHLECVCAYGKYDVYCYEMKSFHFDFVKIVFLLY